MPKTIINHRSFEEIIREMFDSFGEHNITLDEVAKSTKVDKELILLLLNNDSQILTNISKLIYFANFRMVLRKYPMRNYRTINTDDSNEIVIVRRYYPKSSIRYDKSTGEFFNLKFKYKMVERRMTEIYRKQIIQDFVDYKNKNIDNNYRKRYNNNK